MAENQLIIGSLPVLRGAYDSGTSYYRDNQVTMYGSTFQSLADDNICFPPAELREDGKVYAINTDKWIIVANAIEAYNAGEKVANNEARIKELGEYADSPEFIRAYTDTEGKFLWGIQADGSVEWAKGIPAPVRNALKGLEEKIKTDSDTIKTTLTEKINALQDAIDVINASLKLLTDTFSIVSNDEWLHAVVDAENRLLFGIKAENGEVVMPKQDTYKVVSNDEWLAAWIDSQDKILFGIKADGTFWAAKHNFSTGENYDGEIEDINNTLSSMQGTIKDLADKIAGIDTSGVANTVFSVIDDAEERLAVTTDKDERIISYRDKDGVLHEKKGVDTSKYYLNGKERNFVDQTEVESEVTKAAENGAVKLENVDGVSNHNTPNLLIASEMQKTFNDGTNSFTPPNDGYEMSNPIECQAGDWFTRTGTATGMVVVTDENDKNGTRLFNSEGGTLGNTFQIPEDMTWIRYIRMAAEVSGANDGSVVICKGRKAYKGDEKGDFLTLDKLIVEDRNLSKNIRYLQSPDGKYWDLYVDESYQLQIKEVDPEIITNLPSDFPVLQFNGTFNDLFKYICVGVGSKYNFVIKQGGVVKFMPTSKTGLTNSGYGNFERVQNKSGENRYVFGISTSETDSTHVPEIKVGITICDEELNILETGITSGTGYPDIHDEIFIDDNHLILFRYGSKNVRFDDLEEPVRIQGVVIEEIKKIDGKWEVIGSFDTGDYPQLCTDCFGDYTDPDNDISVIDSHPNTLGLDYDGNIILNCRNWDTWMKIRRVENEDGTVTIGSKDLDYDEAIIGRVGGRHNSGYIDSKRVLNDGFSFKDVPATLNEVSDDDWEEWQWFHCHDVKYWGMKNIDGQGYPTYTLFDNNMWTGNSFVTGKYNVLNKHNNANLDPEQNNSEYHFSKLIQLSIDWEGHHVKEYKIYYIPNIYQEQAGGVTMYDEGVLLASYSGRIMLLDFTTDGTEVSRQMYKGAKTLFNVNTSSYRANTY